MSYVQFILNAFEQRDAEAISNAILPATAFFERSRGMQSGTAYDETLIEECSPDDLLRISTAMIDFVRTSPHHPKVGSVVWSLGKLCDPDLKPLFRHFLHANRAGEVHVIWQAVIALQNLGDGLLRGVTTWFDLDEHTFHKRVAEYINRTD